MAAKFEGPRLGVSDPPINLIALAPRIDTGGTYPQPGPGPATNVLSMVRTFAGPWPAYGAPSCAGETLPVYANQALFSLLGISFGGNGQTDFALPDLRGRMVVGGSPQQSAQAVSMSAMIAGAADSAAGDYPFLGAIGFFAGLYPPAGWLAADGSLLPLARNVPLFEAIGAAFGGDGLSTFALPDLRGTAVVGAGQGEAASIALGQRVPAGPDAPVACLGLNYIINVSGMLAPPEGSGGFPDSAALLAEVVAFAGSAVPTGWVPAQGQEMLIAGNEDLFRIIGTTFGGDGEVSFALPDLRTRIVVGS